MKMISWNVNGIRAAIKNGFLDTMADINPEILCLQETRVHKEQVSIDLPEYRTYWYSAGKKGYSGTAVFSKIEPRTVTYGLGIPEHDNEGRVITLEFDDFYLVNVYTPNSQHELVRLEYRQLWDSEFLAFVKRLEETRPVVFCGDLNVAHKEIDLKNPKGNEKNPGFTIEERTDFDRYIESGFIDTFREFNQEPGNYTWWSYRFNARARNIGWRIDYFCISALLRPRLKDAFILKDVTGSDHCPVGIILNGS
ncbi:MAG: exodeoxyribonuclease III [Deltaproteobacteria bacterium]|nr:exodeoxyribonuclease III [Deltaproteobacteria bacterium]